MRRALVSAGSQRQRCAIGAGPYHEREILMNRHRNLTKLAALTVGIAAALPALADTIVSTEQAKHHYVFYSDRDIYYAPESHTYFWMESGRWQSGASLPQQEQDRIVRAKGIEIDLDTDRPYERNDYVMSHYRDSAPATRRWDAGEHYIGGRTLSNEGTRSYAERRTSAESAATRDRKSSKSSDSDRDRRDRDDHDD
jgi:hypothetical protein